MLAEARDEDQEGREGFDIGDEREAKTDGDEEAEPWMGTAQRLTAAGDLSGRAFTLLLLQTAVAALLLTGCVERRRKEPGNE